MANTNSYLKVWKKRTWLLENASRQYNERFDNATYVAAVNGLSIVRINRLIDDAMALCGSPYHAMSHTRWSQAAWDFLALFCEEE